MSSRPDASKLPSKLPAASSMRPVPSARPAASERPASKMPGQSSRPEAPLSTLPEYEEEDLPRSTMRCELKGSRMPSVYKPSSNMPSEYKEPSKAPSAYKPTSSMPSSYKDAPSARPSVPSAYAPPKVFSQAPPHGKVIHCPGCNCPERTPAKSTRPEAKSIMPSRMDEAKSRMASKLDFAPSMAPSSIKSVLRTPEDFKIASRQSMYSSLPVAEQEEQDDWAQKMIEQHGNCPEDKTWERRENPGGYQCDAGGHGMTDELLAEGKGGMLAIASKVWGDFKGPYYKNPVTRKHERVKT